MSNSNNFNRDEFLSRHSNSQVRQFGQEIEVSINDETHESVLILYDQVIELLSQQDYYLAMDLCYTEIQNLKEGLGVDSLGPINSVYTILANVFYEIRHYEDAAKFLRGTLSLQEMKYGVNQPLVANTLSNLAVVLAKEGKYEKVKKLAERALNIYDQSECNEHLIIGKIVNELALYFYERSEYGYQERCCSRALKIFETNLSPNDPEVATATIDLALCYVNRHKYKEAEEMFKKVVSTAYENEFKDTNDKSKWLQMLSRIKVFGIGKDNSKVATNIWQIAEKRERKKGTHNIEEVPPVWYKSANLDTPTFNVALRGLQVLYDKQGKNVASNTLKNFEKQQRTDIPDVTADAGLENSSDLSIPSTSESPPPLPPKRREVVSRTRLPTPRTTPTDTTLQNLSDLQTPSAPPLSELLPPVASKTRTRLSTPPRPPKAAPRQQTTSLEQVIAELQAEIAEKTRQLAEAQRTIETHRKLQ